VHVSFIVNRRSVFGYESKLARHICIMVWPGLVLRQVVVHYFPFIRDTRLLYETPNLSRYSVPLKSRSCPVQNNPNVFFLPCTSLNRSPTVNKTKYTLPCSYVTARYATQIDPVASIVKVYIVVFHRLRSFFQFTCNVLGCIDSHQ
jgi:hypothetical protein